MRWENALIVGYLDGKPAKEVRFAADPVATTLEVVADRDTLSSEAKDCVRVMIRALDQMGHKLPFLLEPVQIEVAGAGRRVGPGLVPLRGGSTGFWIESVGAAGEIAVAVSSPRLGTTAIKLCAK
jgi:beta-galactosidase